MAIIDVGKSSEVEVRKKKAQYVIALNTTHTAVKEDTLPGDGVALLKASLALSTNSSRTSNLFININGKPVLTANFNQDLGMNILCRVLSDTPCTQDLQQCRGRILSSSGPSSRNTVLYINLPGAMTCKMGNVLILSRWRLSTC